jgi:hypothetical protein
MLITTVSITHTAASRPSLMAIAGESGARGLARDQAGDAGEALTYVFFKALHVLTMALLLLGLFGAQF